MSKTLSRWTLAAAAIAAAQVGCNNPVGTGSDEREAGRDKPGGRFEPPMKTEPEKPPARGEFAVKGGGRPVQEVQEITADEVWPEIASYRGWTAHTPAPVRGGHPQGEYIQLFYDATAKAAIGGTGAWPDGTIFVEDNYAANAAGDGPGELEAITVMKKGDGVWFWAQYEPGGSPAKREDGSDIAGTTDVSCVDCHSIESSRRDHVMTEFRADE